MPLGIAFSFALHQIIPLLSRRHNVKHVDAGDLPRGETTAQNITSQ